ncbi:MAG: hypothetical protein L6R35_004710 [Caloplaca aegaea]|nr:MAG: hypothetical protein L6R35_004710 [Caloplaca aegaea]
MWLNRLGDDLASNIRSLEIGAWLDVWRGLRTVLFRWCLLSFAFGGASPGFTIKYMFPDFTATWKFQHSRALHSRPGLCQHLKAEMALILAGKDRITVRTGGLRSIVEAIARYTKHSHLDHPDAQHIARKEPPPPPIWTDLDIQQWACIFPVTSSYSPKYRAVFLATQSPTTLVRTNHPAPPWAPAYHCPKSLQYHRPRPQCPISTTSYCSSSSSTLNPIRRARNRLRRRRRRCCGYKNDADCLEATRTRTADSNRRREPVRVRMAARRKGMGKVQGGEQAGKGEWYWSGQLISLQGLVKWKCWSVVPLENRNGQAAAYGEQSNYGRERE